ncbi:GcrA family cell cycle regulator [Sphingomonas sp. IC-56]|uniref:GcrA family cell cycle regulator n=1 Tax=Sphingomonas sp. IC-56 TaxID=2898529 RepID=UPI001E44BB44|nr:GcrA family cell cycle regulator [Sphingomonas sp. IC-56]MCD2324716.1 GcrA family cell cycle regulator [Sphingomonas sp. IC-56]
MSWTEERIESLKKMWDKGSTATQIAEELGGVSRNAVIGKAHRLGLQSRPSPVKQNEAKAAAALIALTAAAAAPEPVPAPEEAAPPPPAPKPAPAVEAAPEPAPRPVRAAAPAPEVEAEADAPQAAAPEQPAPRPDGPVMRSVGPGGFVRQNPGDQAPPSTPAPPRRLVPAKPSDAIAGKTSLLDLNDRICKWPLGHPGEPDFHFCGDKVNPGFPYCVAHCGHAYQAQLPRRDRRPGPPLPFGGAPRR